jgi:hypothetical protein
VNAYKENGFANRGDYLRSLSDDFGVDYDIITELADILGPDEDFDGLVVQLEDFSKYGNFGCGEPV